MGDHSKIHRFIDAGDEPNKILIPIEGYEKKDLVPLDKAIESIKALLHNIDVMVDIALKNSTTPLNGLTVDEAAAIHLYTMQWPEPYDSLYHLMNRKLRSADRNELTPWFSFLKLFLTALFKLPPVKSTLWRAIKGSVFDQYEKNKIWWGVSSCTTNRETAERFVGNSHERTIFKIDCICGRSVESYSYFQHEEEIILLPGTYLNVVKKWIESEGVYMIELQEADPPYQLIKPPSGNQKRGEQHSHSQIGTNDISISECP